jgi:hypothetical protein
MRSNDWHPRPLFDAESQEPDFLAPLIGVAPPQHPTFPQFPKFPMLAEIQRHMRGEMQHPLLQLSEAGPPSEPASLFQGMLGGNLLPLMQDSIDHPERYDDETQLFLNELAAGLRKAETPEDKARLDAATLDFASGGRQQPKPRPPAPPPKPRAAAVDPYAPGLDDGRAPQVETAGGPMSAYWWARA